MSTAKFDTLSTLDGSRSVPVSTVAQGTARAWVNFNGTGTVAIRAAFNVTSITDNGVGDYTLNFTNAMPNASYAAVGSGYITTTRVGLWSPYVYATGTLRLLCSGEAAGYLTNTRTDHEAVNVAIFD
jgi:hypothetical protein